jgi:hypothetical protein
MATKRKTSPPVPLTAGDRFATLAELAVRFDLHCREASHLRDKIHRLARECGLSDDAEKKFLLDAHEANEDVKKP